MVSIEVLKIVSPHISALYAEAEVTGSERETAEISPRSLGYVARLAY